MRNLRNLNAPESRGSIDGKEKETNLFTTYTHLQELTSEQFLPVYSIKHIILNTYYFLIDLSVFICPILFDRSIIVHLFINKQVCIMNSFRINLTDCVRVHMFKLITSQDSCTCTSKILSISK